MYLDEEHALDLCDGGTVIDQSSDAFDSMMIFPDNVLERCSDVVNVVTPDSRLSNCFTKSYGKYVKGTGAVLATQNMHLLSVVEDLQDRCCNTMREEETGGTAVSRNNGMVTIGCCTVHHTKQMLGAHQTTSTEYVNTG